MRAKLTYAQEVEAIRICGGCHYRIAKIADSGDAFIHVIRSDRTDVYRIPLASPGSSSFVRKL